VQITHSRGWLILVVIAIVVVRVNIPLIFTKNYHDLYFIYKQNLCRNPHPFRIRVQNPTDRKYGIYEYNKNKNVLQKPSLYHTLCESGDMIDSGRGGITVPPSGKSNT